MRRRTDAEGRPRRRRTLGLAIAVLGLVLGACTDGTARVPDLVVEDFEGRSTSLAAMQGEPLVVNVFASWCGPCVAEMPDLQTVHLRRGHEVRVVGVNTQDQRAAARDLVERTGVTYDLLWDPDGALFRALGVVAMPSTHLVDADGRVVHVHAGIVSADALERLIDEHL